jgi:flap endonuclease-1
MGIHNLSKLIKKYTEAGVSEVEIGTLANKTLAIDTSIVLYQFITAIKNHTDDFKTGDGKVTTHIHAILMKTLSLLKKKIKPIYVFDGAAPEIKQETLDSRKRAKEHAQDMLQGYINDEDMVKMRKRSVHITHDQSLECQEMLQLMGIPMVRAPQEADPQCVYLVEKGLAHGVGSEDMDILTFGARKLYRNINNLNKVVEYDLHTILQELEMDMDGFIDMCILLGCDYSSTIEGVGMKRSYDMIKKYGSIERMIEKDPGFVKGKYTIPENFNFRQAREYFRNAPVDEVSKEDLVWRKPDFDALRDVLVNKYGYSSTSTTKHLSELEKCYYSVICNEKDFMKKCKILNDDYDFV